MRHGYSSALISGIIHGSMTAVQINLNEGARLMLVMSPLSGNRRPWRLSTARKQSCDNSCATNQYSVQWPRGGHSDLANPQKLFETSYGLGARKRIRNIIEGGTTSGTHRNKRPKVSYDPRVSWNMVCHSLRARHGQ